MAPLGKESEQAETRSGVFATTHWSVVLEAGGPQTPQSAAALEQLCRTYWYPLYAYLRRTGCNPDDAEDLVQGFFVYFLEGQILRSVEREGGRFRSFLLGTLKHFVSDQKDKASAQKRGGGRQLISWELAEAEHRFFREPAEDESPDRLYERRWASVLLEHAMERLQQEWASSGKADVFAQLKGFVSGEKGLASYAEAADQANLSPNALKSAIFRLRRRYHELVREEVGHTVADPGELKEELRHLLSLFNSG
ncbi:MAG TPA: sigma-70 family RNA polymerase sigma factor [Candidatus Paceibacterota bacterium]|nr:sigma-70 family RNA polymerase sigma factor [Verrucomicrobiota bacterium]HRY51078.1 sigma-70 family RNA polymerase sigma factor [Candidatus Paceibacterota bacterium]